MYENGYSIDNTCKNLTIVYSDENSTQKKSI